MHKQLPKEVLIELVCNGECYKDGYRLEVVRTRITDHTRWSVFHEMIIHDVTDGKYYSSEYSVGATEAQDESPYEFESEMIEVTEVLRTHSIVVDYVETQSEFSKNKTKMLSAISDYLTTRYSYIANDHTCDHDKGIEEIREVAERLVDVVFENEGRE